MEKIKNNRIGEKRLNKQKCLMKIIEYNANDDIIVEFQDKYKDKIHTTYQHFLRGTVKNRYYPAVYDIGMIGQKYPCKINGVNTKEYKTWNGVLERCFNEKYKNEHVTYRDVTCCSEWLLYENFYEWLHNQENFNKWIAGYRWDIDKDILDKNNKIYSPKKCLLVPHNVNSLFVKSDAIRGELPVGVTKHGNKFRARCQSPLTRKKEHLGLYGSVEEAFEAYKLYKENLIKQVAQIEFNKGNITEECYNAMMRYEVEITD